MRMCSLFVVLGRSVLPFSFHGFICLTAASLLSVLPHPLRQTDFFLSHGEGKTRRRKEGEERAVRSNHTTKREKSHHLDKQGDRTKGSKNVEAQVLFLPTSQEGRKEGRKEGKEGRIPSPLQPPSLHQFCLQGTW